MKYLVTKVRKNIGDIETHKQYSDDEIEQALDIRRRDISYVPLVARQHRTPTSYVYKKFYAEAVPGFWETDAEITDGQYAILTPDDFDPINGIWTFNTGRTSAIAYASGVIYDVNAVSADLIENWFASVKSDFSFTRGQRTFNRGEQLQSFKQAADMYRSRSWITVTPFRTD